MKTLERNEQRKFETVCFSITNTFPVAQKSFKFFMEVFILNEQFDLILSCRYLFRDKYLSTGFYFFQ